MQNTLTRHQKFTIAEAIGRYDVQPSRIVSALEGQVTIPILREVQAFSRQVALRLRYIDPLDYNRRWTDWRFLDQEPEADDEICYRIRQLIGEKANGRKIISWRELTSTYAGQTAA